MRFTRLDGNEKSTSIARASRLKSSALVKTGIAYAMLPAQFRHGRSGLSLLQNGHDLAVGKTRIFHRNLLSSDDEKILLMNTLLFRGDYRRIFLQNRFKKEFTSAYLGNGSLSAYQLRVTLVPHRQLGAGRVEVE